jgi:hypothetical protein
VKRRLWTQERLAALLVALTLAPACNNSGTPDKPAEGGVEDLTIVVEADKSRIMQEEQSLQQKRDSVQAETDRLAKERAEVDQKLASLSKKDKKQRDELEAESRRLAEEDKRIRDNAKSFEQERSKLDDDKTKLLERISKMTATKGGLTIEQREQAIAQREKDVAAREKAVAEREKGLGTREGEVTKRLADVSKALDALQAGGGFTKTVVVNQSSPSSAPSGGNATKATAQKAQKAVRTAMDAKGLLSEDLPPTAKEMQQAGNEALENKDFASAQSSFGDLLGVIDSIQINRAFIEAKMQRVRKIAEKKQLSDEGRSLLDEISNAFADGRYDRANRKINQALALISK